MLNKQGRFSFSLIVSFICFLVLSACSQARQENLIIPTVFNNATATQQIYPLPTNTTKPPIPTSTPTQQSIAKCPIPNALTTILEAKTGGEAQQAILDYLNQGGFIEQLQKEIKNLGTIVDSYQVFVTDTNDDSVKEIIVAINFAPPKNGDWEDAYGNLSIYNCVDGSYHVTNIAGEKREKIKVLAVENLLNSNVPEILVSRQWSFF